MKEWYLDIPAPDITSGYENDEIDGYAKSNFEDVLLTSFSDTVLLYDNDLTNPREVQCVIQGNTADTQLTSMSRIGLFPIGTVKAGMYIRFENNYWLAVGYPGNNKSYEKVVFALCQYKLKWQNSDGEIIERWTSVSSAAKYDTGEKGNKVIMLSTDNLMLLLPDDNESLNLDGKRVFIDKRTIPKKVYKLTRSDDVLYDYGEHGAVLGFIADKTELNTATDNQELRIADYIPTTSSSSVDTDIDTDEGDEITVSNGNYTATISGNSKLKIGFARTYIAEITDENGDEVVWNNEFSIRVTQKTGLVWTIENNKIKLLAENDALVDERLKIEVVYQESVIGSLVIVISGAF